ncbi:hypothetical protein C0991_010203 [Blastosporella zonata]|nr:hypothetical protein C0991_010203 [Blastosporella zonata]
MPRLSSLLIAACLLQATFAAPASHLHLAPLDDGPTTPDPNLQLWDSASTSVPEPVRGKLGASIIGPKNMELERQNSDLLAPPTTDHGQIENLKWPFSLSHTRLAEGGWAREQNMEVLPVATALAGVNMRLKAGAIRELHWHKTAEVRVIISGRSKTEELRSQWAYILKGDARISTMTPAGEVFVGDVSEGDLWYFPAGHPHSIQAKNTTGEGTEFLLIFDSGHFSEDATFLLTDWLAHVPKSVLAKNFGVADLSLFDHIPEKELYIFPSSAPPEDPTADMVIPNNTPNPYTFALSKVVPRKTACGSVKVVDSSTFKVADKISAVEVVVEVGGMRELHVRGFSGSRA